MLFKLLHHGDQMFQYSIPLLVDRIIQQCFWGQQTCSRQDVDYTPTNNCAVTIFG